MWGRGCQSTRRRTTTTRATASSASSLPPSPYPSSSSSFLSHSVPALRFWFWEQQQQDIFWLCITFRSYSVFAVRWFRSTREQSSLGRNLWLWSGVALTLICDVYSITGLLNNTLDSKNGFIRLGRLRSGGAKGPGIFFVIPCIDKYHKVGLNGTRIKSPATKFSQLTHFVSQIKKSYFWPKF